MKSPTRVSDCEFHYRILWVPISIHKLARKMIRINKLRVKKKEKAAQSIYEIRVAAGRGVMSQPRVVIVIARHSCDALHF